MKFKNIRKEYKGEYLTYYKIRYETESGNEKLYEMVSRNSDISDRNGLNANKPDAVIMIIHDIADDKILLNLEYRMAVGEWVYNFPAGLIDDGETIGEAAVRELKEETRLDLTEIKEFWKDSYSAVGLSNEKGSVIIGTAEGDIQKSNSEEEEIKASWYTKAEVRSLLAKYPFAARTQAYCALWSQKQLKIDRPGS